MRGSELAEAMAVAVDRLVNAREGTGALDRAIESVVGTIGRFGGKDATSYLEAYRAEMIMRDIPTDRRLSGFPRVVAPSIHAEVLEVLAGCQTWEEFELRLLERYGLDDSLRLSRLDFMAWVESPGKGRNTTALLQEFEKRFARLSTLDRTVLETSRVLLFVKSVDALDREKVGLLLETDEGLTTDWAVVKRVCSRFDKRHEWSDGAPKAPVRRPEVSVSAPARREETRPWLEKGSTSNDQVKGSSGGAALEELTQMVRDLQIAQARRDSSEPPRDRRPPALQRCMWCDATGHIRKDCADFAGALRANVVYLSNGRVHASETRRALELNTGHGGMKRLMEEAAARHAEAANYAASAGIRVGGDKARKEKDSGFWPLVLENLSEARLKKEEADRAEQRVQEVTGWDDPVEEKTGFVEAACQNYKVLVEDKQAGRAGGVGPSKRYETRFGPKPNNAGNPSVPDGKKQAGFRLSTEIERTTDLRKVLEERILDSKVELSLREVLGIAKREFHDSIVDLVKRKRLSTEPDLERSVEVRTTHLEDSALKDEVAESHYARPHWARATTETPVRIGDVPEPVVALVDHGSEINMMSMEFYRKGKWPINTKHGWKIRAATRATEELHGACPNVRVKIGDVEIDQHFFVQETSSHPVILGEPYITAARMETKVLDNGSAYARVKSQDGRHSVQFMTVCPNHERNRKTLGGDGREDF